MEHRIKSGKESVNSEQSLVNSKTKKKLFTIHYSLFTNRGFTLIEIMIVMTIIGILLTIAQPQFQHYITRAKETVLKENLFTLRDVIDQYYADKGRYPDALQDLVTNGYIRKIPNDPFTRSSDKWVTVPPEEGENRIYDIHSGSDLVTADGTPYNEW